MSPAVRFLLIPATWLIACCLLILVEEHTDGYWPVPLILLIGCSGSIVAVLNP